MHTAYASPLYVSSLAHDAGMSVSAIHFHFKAVNATSPVQYLKTIRLHKAKMLMVQEAMSASVAANRVGYDSASLFGAPPADEAQRARQRSASQRKPGNSVVTSALQRLR